MVSAGCNPPRPRLSILNSGKYDVRRTSPYRGARQPLALPQAHSCNANQTAPTRPRIVQRLRTWRRCPMVKRTHEALLVALRAWSNQVNARIAVTASARQCQIAPSGVRRWITLEDLSKSTAFCLERVSRDLLGRSSVRTGARLTYAGALEGGASQGDKRMHAHLIVGGLPPTATLQAAEHAITRRWQASRWGYDDIEVRWLASREDVDRWVNYFLKDITKETLDHWITNVPFRTA